jgi:cytoskeletal protein CcmA (bactofilin family)
MRPDIKLFDDHIEIAGTVKGDLNSGGSIDFDAEVSIAGNAQLGANVNIDGSASIAGDLQLGGATLRGLSADLYLQALDRVHMQRATIHDIIASALEVEPGLDDDVCVSYYTKWDPVVEGYLAKKLHLKPDTIVFTTAAEEKGTTSFDLMVEFKALVARVELLEKGLHTQIRKAAYQLWEAGGCQPGRALDDWLAAERDILGT